MKINFVIQMMIWTVSNILSTWESLILTIGKLYSGTLFNPETISTIGPLFSAIASVITAIIAICVFFLAKKQLGLAKEQLDELVASAGNTSILELYEIFDEEIKRDYRRVIFKGGYSNMSPKEIPEDDWDIIERIATDMDVVGTLIKHDLVTPELIYERYAEVILPIWKEIHVAVQYRRLEKGGWGWNNFEIFVEMTREWSLRERGTDTYDRF